MHGRRIHVVHLGRTEYVSCWALQRRLARLREANVLPDLLLLTEHDHVYTIGRAGGDEHLLAGGDELAARGVAVVHTDRGGDITYHGPGQLVGYPILDLHQYYLDLHRYLRDIEEAVIGLLRAHGLAGVRVPGYTGVWAGGDKVCAIGVRTRRWVTTHGFALNVAPDLSFFGRIIPCGIFEKGVTSMQELLGRPVSLEEVTPEIVRQFGGIFGAEIVTDGMPAVASDGTLLPEPTHMQGPYRGND